MKHSERTKSKISLNNSRNRKVMCIEDGEVFRNVKKASDKYGIHYSGISRVCNGTQKTAAERTWIYLD